MADAKTRLDSELCMQLLKADGLTPGTPEWHEAATQRFQPSGDGVTYFDTKPEKQTTKNGDTTHG